LSEDDALLNARLAKILHNEHYDSERKQILYWTPPDACNNTDDGAGVSAKTA
jgi:hypothetical protein